MTRYIVTKTHIAYGYVTEYKFLEKRQATELMAKLDKDLMAKLDKDPRYTYTYREEQ